METSTDAPTTGDQLATVDLTVEEIHVDPTFAMDPTTYTETVDATVTPPLSLRAMKEIFMTTQEVHGQLIDKLLTEVAALRANFF